VTYTPQRVAYHEAAHVVAAVRLGGRVAGPVTIIPSKRWLGSAWTLPRRAPQRDFDRVDVGRPLALWPAALRRQLECETMVVLAGGVGELLAPRSLEYPPPDPELDLEREANRRRRAAAAVEALPAAQALLLARGDDPDIAPAKTDPERAHELAELLAGPAGASSLLAHLQQQVAAVVLELPGRLDVERLAKALLERDVLAAADVRALLEAKGPS
jgi:hypothetical protein